MLNEVAGSTGDEILGILRLSFIIEPRDDLQ
jgi:hypothetical protein